MNDRKSDGKLDSCPSNECSFTRVVGQLGGRTNTIKRRGREDTTTGNDRLSLPSSSSSLCVSDELSKLRRLNRPPASYTPVDDGKCDPRQRSPKFGFPFVAFQIDRRERDCSSQDERQPSRRIGLLDLVHWVPSPKRKRKDDSFRPRCHTPKEHRSCHCKSAPSLFLIR